MSIEHDRKNKSRNVSILISLTLLSAHTQNPLQAQNSTDAGLWGTISLEANIGPKLTFLATEEIRLKENFTQLNLFYTDIGLEYELARNFKTALMYRSIQKYIPGNSVSFRHRLLWDLSLRKKSGNLIFSYRHRLQAEVRNVYSSETGYMPEWFSRNKFQAKYDFDSPFVPYAAVEIRFQINDPREPQLDYLLHHIRYQAGLDYKFGLGHTLGIYYLIQQAIHADPEDLYILGLEYSLKIQKEKEARSKKPGAGMKQ